MRKFNILAWVTALVLAILAGTTKPFLWVIVIAIAIIMVVINVCCDDD